MSMRESFENWPALRGRDLMRDDSDTYYTDLFVDRLWFAWRESRKAIVLPESPHGDSYVTIQQVKQAIGAE